MAKIIKEKVSGKPVENEKMVFKQWNMRLRAMLIFVFIPSLAFCAAESRTLTAELEGINPKTVVFSTEDAVHINDEFQVVRGSDVVALVKVIKMARHDKNSKSKEITAEIIQKFAEIDFGDTLVRFSKKAPPEEKKETPPETKPEEMPVIVAETKPSPEESKLTEEKPKEEITATQPAETKELPSVIPGKTEIIETQVPEEELKEETTLSHAFQKASRWGEPQATFTFGVSNNTNIKNKNAPDDVNDSFYDVSLKTILPYTFNKKNTLNMELNYKQDWKGKNESLNIRSQQVNVRFLHAFSQKFSGQIAFLYQDYEIFTVSGVQAGLTRKIFNNHSLTLNYFYFKRRYENINQNGNNHIARLDWKIPLAEKASFTPFLQYEKNEVILSPSSDYMGITGGLRCNLKVNKKITVIPGYDYRIRDYNRPAEVAVDVLEADEAQVCSEAQFNAGLCQAKTLSGVTRKEKRHQFSFTLNYLLQKNATLILQYTSYKNDAVSSSNTPGVTGNLYAIPRNYTTHVFYAAVSLKSLKAKK